MVKQRLISAMIPSLILIPFLLIIQTLDTPHGPSHPSSLWNNVTRAHIGTQGDHREDCKLALFPLPAINWCTAMCIYDNRGFFSMNPPPSLNYHLPIDTHPNKEKGRLINVRVCVFTEMQFTATTAPPPLPPLHHPPHHPPPHIPCRLKSLDSLLMT